MERKASCASASYGATMHSTPIFRNALMHLCAMSGVTSTAFWKYSTAALRLSDRSACMPLALFSARDECLSCSVPAFEGKFAPSKTIIGVTL
jgi:hypothetical protein